MNGTATAARLWTALLVLVGVLVMHGAQCAGASADVGHASSAAHPVDLVPTAMLVPGSGAAAVPLAAVDGSQARAGTAHPAAHSPTSVTVADSPPDDPRATGGHLWTVCLAVLATAVAVLLAVLLPQPLLLGRRTLAHVRARLGQLPLARPPDLSELCLLRI